MTAATSTCSHQAPAGLSCLAWDLSLPQAGSLDACPPYFPCALQNVNRHQFILTPYPHLVLRAIHRYLTSLSTPPPPHKPVTPPTRNTNPLTLSPGLPPTSYLHTAKPEALFPSRHTSPKTHMSDILPGAYEGVFRQTKTRPWDSGPAQLAAASL